MCAVIIVNEPAFTVIIYSDVFIYQFLPRRDIRASGDNIISRIIGTTSSDTNPRLRRMRTRPISVVCNRSVFAIKSFMRLTTFVSARISVYVKCRKSRNCFRTITRYAPSLGQITLLACRFKQQFNFAHIITFIPKPIAG